MISTWWQDNVRDLVLDELCLTNPEFCSRQKHVTTMLLAIWATEKDDCDKEKCSLGRCIKDIDDKLRSGKFSFRPNNPNVVPAPAIIRDFLDIESINKKQHEVFTSNKKLLIINGPAGAGKSVLLIAKIIELMKSNKSYKVILFVFNTKFFFQNI